MQPHEPKQNSRLTNLHPETQSSPAMFNQNANNSPSLEKPNPSEETTYYMGMYTDSDKDYSSVAWYQKAVPVMLLCLFTPPIGAILMLIGDVYLLDQKTKRTWKLTAQARVAVAVIAIAGPALLIYNLF